MSSFPIRHYVSIIIIYNIGKASVASVSLLSCALHRVITCPRRTRIKVARTILYINKAEGEHHIRVIFTVSISIKLSGPKFWKTSFSPCNSLQFGNKSSLNSLLYQVWEDEVLCKATFCCRCVNHFYFSKDVRGSTSFQLLSISSKIYVVCITTYSIISRIPVVCTRAQLNCTVVMFSPSVLCSFHQPIRWIKIVDNKFKK